MDAPISTNTTTDESAIAEAIRLAGGPASLAKALGESTQTVVNWRARGIAPANRCVAIEQVTGVPRRRLRPADWSDYWPEEKSAAITQPEADAIGHSACRRSYGDRPDNHRERGGR